MTPTPVPPETSMRWPSEAVLSRRFDELMAVHEADIEAGVPLDWTRQFELDLLLGLKICRRQQDVTAAFLHRWICYTYVVKSFDEFIVVPEPEQRFAEAWDNLQKLV